MHPAFFYFISLHFTSFFYFSLHRNFKASETPTFFQEHNDAAIHSEPRLPIQRH